MADLTIPRGDYGYNINFTVQSSGGVAYNLTGYTIKFKVWKDTKSGILFVNGSCTITVAADGTCYYTVVSGDFNEVGIFKMELELTKSGIVESTQTYELEVARSG